MRLVLTHLMCARWEMICDGVLDDFEQLLRPIDGSNRQPLEQLYHESTESLESPRYTDLRVDLDEDTLCGVNVDLQHARLVEGRI